MSKLNKLTPQQRLITLSYAKGLRGLECAKDAGYSYKNAKTAAAAISRIVTKPAAKAYLQRISQEAILTAEEGTILTLQEKMEFCARVLRCRIHTEPDDSDLLQELQITETESSTVIKRKLPDKRLIIETDNKLQGHGQGDNEDPTTTDVLSEIIKDIASSPTQSEKM